MLKQNAVNKGFALIELLVVVLIIGVLAAIALPQYQRAVEKSQSTQALAILNSLVEAQDFYYLTNSTYTNDFDKLDVSIQLPGTTSWLGARNTFQARSTQNWSVVLENGETSAMAVAVGRVRGKYKNQVGYAYYWLHAGEPSFPFKKRVCLELSSLKTSGSYCQQIAKGAYAMTTKNGTRVYLL